jgi:hypothetical protein
MLLTSDFYRQQLEQIHSEISWGKAAEMSMNMICGFLERNLPGTVLDYGAGRRYLERELPGRFPDLVVKSYDPGIPEISSTPEPCDVVLCIDVLEHVEPEYLDSVLDDLARVTLKSGLLHIATRPASKLLPDGRNSHLIIESHDWWLDKIQKYFSVTWHRPLKDRSGSRFEVARKTHGQ